MKQLTPGETKVRQPAAQSELLRLEYQQVAGLDVPVHDAHAVQVLGTLCHVDDKPGWRKGAGWEGNK